MLNLERVETKSTLKRSGKLHNGSLPIPRGQKNLSVQIKSQNNVAEFFYIRGVVQHEFVPTERRVNQVYYLEVLERLLEKVRRKRPEHFANNSWILHHDNAHAHTALSVREFLATKQITVLEHSAYSPDLAPNDFYLFPKVKEMLKGRHFDDIDYIRSDTTAALEAIPQNQFQNCFEGWTRRWHRCIAFKGENFEDDHGGFQQ
jgi:transposase